MTAKIAAGAQFAQTQFCMDAGVARRYMARLAEHGLDQKIKLIIGVAPLRSAKSARWMKEKLFGTVMPDEIIERMEGSSDPIGEGVRIAVEVIEELSKIPGIGGVHIMAPMNDAVVPGVISEAKQRVARMVMA